MKETYKQKSVHIDEKKHTRLKIDSTKLGISIEEFLDNIIEDYYSRNKQKEKEQIETF